MSHHFNPYVQGWNAGNIPTGQSPWQPGHGPAPSPSVFGALPTMGSYAGNGRSPPASDFQVFRITNLDPNVLNASVVSPQGTSAFRIITDPSQPLRTIWRDSSRRVFATVDWGTRSTVEMPGLFPRQSIRSWLRLSSDRTYVPRRNIYCDCKGTDHLTLGPFAPLRTGSEPWNSEGYNTYGPPWIITSVYVSSIVFFPSTRSSHRKAR